MVAKILSGHKTKKYYLLPNPGSIPGRKLGNTTRSQIKNVQPGHKSQKILPGHKPRMYNLVSKNTIWSQNQKILPGVPNQESITWTQKQKLLNVPKSRKYYLVQNPESILGRKPGNTTRLQTQKTLPDVTNPESSTWSQNPESTTWTQTQKVQPGHKPRKY